MANKYPELGEIWKYHLSKIDIEIEILAIDAFEGYDHDGWRYHFKVLKNSGANGWRIGGSYYIDGWQLNNYYKNMKYCSLCRQTLKASEVI